MNERDNLAGALRLYENAFEDGGEFSPIIRAARERLGQLPETCPRCKGKKRVNAVVDGIAMLDFCSNCPGSRGEVYPDGSLAAIEDAIETALPSFLPWSERRHVAFVVLDALNKST